MKDLTTMNQNKSTALVQQSESESDSHEFDLPLMSNVKDVLVEHFILDLNCDFSCRTFAGSIILFIRPVKRKSALINSESNLSNDTIDETSGCVSSETIEETVLSEGHVCETNHCGDVTITNELSDIGLQKGNTCRSCGRETDEGQRSNSQSYIGLQKENTRRSCDNGTDEGQRSNSQPPSDFPIILDCCELEVFSVEEVLFLSDTQKILELLKWKERHKHFSKHQEQKSSELKFSVEKWCIKIYKEFTASGENCPFCIRIYYKTKPSGASVKWAFDQDNNSCAFTHGHWINNRSWFPGQDSPVSMATWQASVHVPGDFSVLMSGDCNASVIQDENGDSVYHYNSTMSMPISTVAIAIGQWSHVTICQQINNQESNQSNCSVHQDGSCHVNFSSSLVLPCRLFAPPSMLAKAESEVKGYLPRCMAAVHQLLGKHPFCRLDILVVPECFASLALACPSLMFISQTLLPGDQSCCIRLAHELSHSWFGLLIGPSDWTEEWLTEGFATYLEDCIHGNLMEWSVEYQRDFSDLRAAIRQRTLLGEITISDEDLQVLRPNRVKSEEDLDGDFVKNGMNPDKTFTQVHYLKGYFLLRYLSHLTGVDRFNNFIKQLVSCYHGQLISSQNVLDLLFDIFPELGEKGVTGEGLCKQWLDCPGIPDPIRNFSVPPGNRLLEDVQKEYRKWTPLCKKGKSREKGDNAKKPKMSADLGNAQHEKVKFLPDQLVLLLEMLLELPHCPHPVLVSIHETYKISTSNADVRHRWCELVIKHRCRQCYSQIREFLIHDQAMGVYLYGEMMISEDKQLQELAEMCYKEISEYMEEGPYRTVHSMIYGD